MINMNFAKETWQWIVISILAFSIIFGLFWNILSSLDNFYYDRLTGLVAPSSQITIVGIDEMTLEKLGRWPINRDYYSELITKLEEKNASVIGVNILFNEKSENDDKLLQTLDNSNVDITLASNIETESENNNTLSINPKLQGYTNLPISKDGNIREVYLSNYQKDECLPSFSLSVYLKYLDKNIINCKNNLVLEDTKITNKVFFDTTDTQFNIVSMIDVLEGNIPDGLIENKIVLVGITNNDSKNLIVDKINLQSNKSMSSVEVQANIINSLLQKKYKTPLAISTLILIVASIFILLFILYFRYKSAKLIIVITLIFQVINIGLGLILFEIGFIYPAFSISMVIFGGLAVNLIYRLILTANQSDLLKEAFTRYVSRDVLNDIIKSRDTEVLAGKKQEISTLFCDIRGFTTLSEQNTPEELFKILNIYFGAVSKIIVDNRGTLDKYMGDAVMAFWNAPLKTKKHALLTVQSALEILECVKSIHVNNNLLTEIFVGIGVNTGNVLVGNLGSKIRYDYTVIGDEVNLASRLEDLTKKYGVDLLIGEKTYLDIKDSLPDKYLIRLVDEIRVKGKHIASKIYEVCKNSDEKRKVFSRYEIGYNFYAIGEFEKASEILNKCYEEHSDKPSFVLLERIKYLKANNLTDEDFDYIWNWDSK